MSLFLAAAGIWLAVMENILRHDGYRGRTVVAACIAIHGLATLLLLVRHERAVLRTIVVIGAVAIILLGVRSILRILRAQHFEGFVFLIGLALVFQGAFTLATLLPPPNGAASRMN